MVLKQASNLPDFSTLQERQDGPRVFLRTERIGSRRQVGSACRKLRHELAMYGRVGNTDTSKCQLFTVQIRLQRFSYIGLQLVASKAAGCSDPA